MAEARLLLGKPVAREINERTLERTERIKQRLGRPLKLVVLSVDDPAGQSYLKSLKRSAKKVGAEIGEQRLDDSASTASVRSGIAALNEDRSVDGILVQEPLPARINRHSLAQILDPAKDVDGITPTQAGLLFHGAKNALAPSTARAVIEILDFYAYGLQGLEVIIIGRSTIVGKPVGLLALSRHATVTWCHTRTISLRAVCKRAELLIVAAGRPRFVDASFVRPGATVIDVGINEEDGKLVGDVDGESITTFATAYTPVPGGVGPVTVACLYANLLDAALARTRR